MKTSLTVSLEEVIHVRGTRLSAYQSEAVLLQLLRHLDALPSGDDPRAAGRRDPEARRLEVKDILLNGSGHVYLQTGHDQWSVCQLANALATVTANSDCDVTSSPLADWSRPGGRNKSSAGTSRQAIQVLEQRVESSDRPAAKVVLSLYKEVLGSVPLLNGRSESGPDNGGYSTEDSAISSDHYHLSRHPSTDSLSNCSHRQPLKSGPIPAPEPVAMTTAPVVVSAAPAETNFRRRRPIRIARTRSSIEGVMRHWPSSSSSLANPVHRAPSRLYKLNDPAEAAVIPAGTAVGRQRRKSFSALRDLQLTPEPEDDDEDKSMAAPSDRRKPREAIPSCYGPEFIVKSCLVPHLVTLCHQPKKKKIVTVLLLDGQRIQVECDPAKTRIAQLFQMCVEHLNIDANDAIFFGLSSIRNGHFVFPRAEDKVNTLAPDNYKQLPYQGFNIYFRFRFYIHSTLLLQSADSEHLLYLQLRKDVLENRWRVEPAEEVQLAALALLIEFGPYQEKVHGGGSYFHADHYLSPGAQRWIRETSQNIRSLERLHQRLPKDLARRETEFNFVARVIRTDCYGFHNVHVIEDDGLRTTPLNLLIGLQGLRTEPHPAAVTSIIRNDVQNRSSEMSIHWSDIKSLTHTKHHIVVSLADQLSSRKLRFCVGTTRCKEAFDLLISHQKMAEELKCRKLFSRKVEPERIRRLQVDKPVDTSQPEVIMPESPLKPNVQPAESNAVRIYVPFSDSRKTGADELDSSSNSAQFRNTSTDVTTRLIQVDNESPVPELVRPGTSSGTSSPTAVSRTSRDSVCGAPSGPSSPRKSTLVRMGTKISTDALIREKYRLFNDPVNGSGAYVVDTSVKSEDESLTMDSHESISQSLAERFDRLPRLPSSPPLSPAEPAPQRENVVRFSKDPDGSLGILIARGINGGIYLMGLTPNGPAQRQTSLKPGDRILSVNGKDCRDLEYGQVIDYLRQIPRHVEMLVLQDHPSYL